jgi:hypothetical protein
MTREPCKRSWEVEALEDGRLLDADRASFERHARTCDECARAVARLHELGAVLRDLPTPEHSDLERRRARARLLAAASGRLVRDGRRRLRWTAFALAPALFALIVLFVVRRDARHPESVAAESPPAATVPAPPPVFEVMTVEHADFTSEREDSVSRVTLRTGAASFHVEQVEPGARFLVQLPDGEVEVRGTRFVVDVADGQTRSVEVSEGSVAVRLTGFEGTLHAGERWSRAGAGAPAASAGAPTAEPPAAASRAFAAPLPSTAAAPPRLPPLPGPRFADAMGAFNAGDYGAAERLFAVFLREFPSDSRAQDAMFLIADARARRGDTAGARQAARAYLERFPEGLRAPAAARLARELPASP